jgi:hypothetical protein
MKNDIQIIATKLLLTVGAVGMGIEFLKDLELIFSVLLKFISIVSFVIVIVINLPKFVKTVNTYLKRNAKKRDS